MGAGQTPTGPRPGRSSAVSDGSGFGRSARYRLGMTDNARLEAPHRPDVLGGGPVRPDEWFFAAVGGHATVPAWVCPHDGRGLGPSVSLDPALFAQTGSINSVHCDRCGRVWHNPDGDGD